jgi:hypothetical protein
MLQCSYCSAEADFSVKEVIDKALESYEFMSQTDPERVALFRARVAQYLDKLTSAGQADLHQLTEYALAYVKELHEGPDPRFTGC